MEKAMQLRHRVWEYRMKLVSEEGGLGNRLGEDGKNALKEALKVLENIEAKLGVAEYQLQIPGALLSKELSTAVEDVLSSIDAFLGDRRVKQMKEGTKHVLEVLSLANTKVSEKPLVMEEELTVVDTHKKPIVRMLMESGNDELSVIPIIGMPGTGKTTLTQHLYHDSRVCEYFTVRHWVSLSDIRESPSKLLNLVFRHKSNDAHILEKFHSVVDGKRYLLILDDVTLEDNGAFLRDLLCNVSQGSRVVLTSADMATLGNIECLQLSKDAPYELKCVSEDEAWSLFKGITFNDGAEKGNAYKLKSDIGLKLCSMYARVPRLLKNLAMILQTREDWEYICDKMLSSIEDPLKTNLSKVNLISYKDLSSNIQQCVRYCSLFPADFKFIKADLLHLWDAQEFLSTRQTKPEGLDGDENFEKLLNDRYLIGDHENDSNNDVTARYKMESLVNEFLKSVAKPEFCLVDEGTGEIDVANIMHLSFPVNESTWEAPSWVPDAKQLKSLLFLPCKSSTVGIFPNIDEVLSSLRQLRALDLAAVNCENLPSSLGELTDLRYLRLGVSSEYLPQSITSLTKLQTLDLRQSSVTMLPRGFHRLVGLKHLYTGDRLMDMPPDFGQLTSLQTLDVFIVGKNNSMDALSQLKGLVGKLKIRYEHQHVITQEPKDTDYILKDTYLTDISLIWSSTYGGRTNDMFECLQPPQSLKNLSLCRWKGVRFPPQLHGILSLCSLVSLHIEDFSGCEYLPALSTLPNLQSLQLWDLSDLEYMETSVDDTSSSADFFPSLKFLMLANLPKLKAWSPKSDKHRIFSELVEFRISGCPKLRSVPQMQWIKSLETHYVNGVLLEHILSSQRADMKTLSIVSVHELNSLSFNFSLVSLTIRRCSELRKLTIEHSVVEKLEVHECSKLVDITMSKPCGGSELRILELKRCEALNWLDMNQDGDHHESNLLAHSEGQEAWEQIKFLRALKLVDHSRLGKLPIGLRYLQRLEELSLHSLHGLKFLPEWIVEISQLRRLTIRNCPLLTTIPESLCRLSKLEELQIHNCTRLKAIPESIPGSSWTLDIKECPKLPTRLQQQGQN